MLNLILIRDSFTLTKQLSLMKMENLTIQSWNSHKDLVANGFDLIGLKPYIFMIFTLHPNIPLLINILGKCLSSKALF